MILWRILICVLLQKIGTFGKDIYTAPVFRSKPEIALGFLHGGYWKYSAKPSNILLFSKTVYDETDEEHTIQDDIVIAGQDFAAGLVRMGILPKLLYLLEVSLIIPKKKSLLLDFVESRKPHNIIFC